MATTQCPACSSLIEHRPNFAISVTRQVVGNDARTLLTANGAVVVHGCTKPGGADELLAQLASTDDDLLPV